MQLREETVFHNAIDLKPSNIMIAMYDDQPVPKVIDFGVASIPEPPYCNLWPQVVRQSISYKGIAQRSVERMSEIQEKMRQEIVDVLPVQWRERLKGSGTVANYP